MGTENDCWKFDSPIASLRHTALSARVDVEHPQSGVHDLRSGDSIVNGVLLATEWVAETGNENSASSEVSAGWPLEVSDAYIRGGDLIASYGRFPNSHYAPQIYWRLERDVNQSEQSGTSLEIPSPLPTPPSALSLIVSVQTDLLESHPRIRVSTQLPAVEFVRVPAQGTICLLWRLPGGAESYAEIVTQSDYRAPPTIERAGDMYTAHWELFAEFLEKGVIRRAQITSVFLPRKGDAELARECCAAIERRPLPLTT